MRWQRCFHETTQLQQTCSDSNPANRNFVCLMMRFYVIYFYTSASLTSISPALIHQHESLPTLASLLSTRPVNRKNLILALSRNLRSPIAVSSPMQSHLALLISLNIRRVDSVVEDFAGFLCDRISTTQFVASCTVKQKPKK